MVISKKSWDNYINTLREINDAAAKYMEMWLNMTFKDGIIDTVTTDSFGNNLIDISYMVAKDYGNASAAVSAQMYDAIAELSGVVVPPAEMAPTATYNDMAKTVQGVLKTSQNREELSSAIGRWVKAPGVTTTRLNAQRDHAQIAWVPSGDTCAFCIMLASNGWQDAYTKKDTYKDHIHSNCDCTHCVRFRTTTQLAGYDPDKYYEEYHDAEGKTYEEKLNSMRRKFYAQNKEQILAQKADAYAKRQELNSSQAEETNVN